MQLTNFSKILIIIAFIAGLTFIGMTCYNCSSGCNRYPQQDQGYYQQPYPPQPTVQYVTQPDGTSFMMNYLLYQQLMNQGGSGAVNNYYYNHRSDPEFQPTQQQEYEKTYQVETQKSKGFGISRQSPKPADKQINTSKSSGFGTNPQPSNQVSTQRSSGFGNNKPTEVSTNRSSGFSTPKTTSTPSVSTSKSSGFGSSNSTSTKKSNGFGKKN